MKTSRSLAAVLTAIALTAPAPRLGAGAVKSFDQLTPASAGRHDLGDRRAGPRGQGQGPALLRPEVINPEGRRPEDVVAAAGN